MTEQGASPKDAWTVFTNFLERRAGKLSTLDETAGAAAQACCARLRSGSRVQLELLEPRWKKAAQSFLLGLDGHMRTDRIMRLLKIDLQRFCDWAPQLFAGHTMDRDLLMLNEAVKLFNRYNTSEKSYLFLYMLADHIRGLAQQPAYQKLMRAGASPVLKKFFFDLRVECRLTTRELTDGAAQKLAQELGETEAILRFRIQELEWQLEESQALVEGLRQQALAEGIYRLAQALQTRTVPVLDQLYLVMARLRELDNPDPDQLRVLIALEECFAALDQLGLQPFPQGEREFHLGEQDLVDYQYTSGRPFEAGAVRRVRVLAPGWKVGPRLVVPARVCEVEGRRP